jgi:hypothetical protein
MHMKHLITLAVALLAAFSQRALASWAEFGPQETYPARRAGADLSSFQYRVVRFAGADNVNVASNDVSLAATEVPRGILQNNPSSGQPATVAFMGLSKAKAGASITVDTYVTTNGSGKVVAVTSGDIAIGTALEASGAEDDIITVQLFPPVRCGSVV